MASMTAQDPLADPGTSVRPAGLLRRVGRRAPLWLGALLVAAVTVMAVAAPVLAPQDPNAQQLLERLSEPGTQGHVLGTDKFGRDLLSRLIYGSRVSLLAGVLAVALGAGIGSVLGLIAGFFGSWLDNLIGRLFDVLLAFPAILLALAIVAAIGPSLRNTILAIGITTIPQYGRVMRSATIALRSREFIEASTALGGSRPYVLARHVAPNVLSPLIVTATIGIASAILIEATLSFLGLGVAPPTATWGSIISDGKQYLDTAPWISTFAGFAIMAAVLGFSLLGDGLRDLLDPRLRR